MDKVFLVWRGEYSDRVLLGVFTTREKADEAALAWGTHMGDEPEIGEIAADDLAPNPHGLYLFALRMKSDGNISSIENRGYLDERGGVRAARGPQCLDYTPAKLDQQIIHVFARDQDHAIKIAADFRRKLIAMNKWGKVESA